MSIPTSQEQLERWLSAPRENENLEFKEAKAQLAADKLFKYCVALANESGGRLILGVSNKLPRKIVGTKAFNSPEGIASKIYSTLRFRVDVEEFEHADGRILIFHIPSRPSGTAYQFEGAYWMRSTEDLVPMSEDRLRKIFDEGKPDWLDQNAVEGCSDEDVIRLLDTQSYFDLLKLPYPSNRDGVLRRFESEKLISRSDSGCAVSNLGALTFAKQLDEFDFLSRKAPRVVVYEGNNKLKTKLDRFETKGYAVGFAGLVEFIDGLIPANEIVTSALREEVKMFPVIAIRELVANALIHQDFSEGGAFVSIEIYSDRLEVSNPGQPSIPTERFIDEYKSRNESLANLMRRLGICEEKGSGIDRVVLSSELFQLPAPDFRVGDIHTTVVLFAHKDFEEMDRNDRIRACYQHCCLKYVMNEKMTNKTLRERFKLPQKKSESVSRVIRDTLESNKIKVTTPPAASTRYRGYVPYWA